MVQEQLQRSMTKSSRQTRELGRKLSKLTEVQAAVGWGLILLVIALLGVIYLNQSSRTAAVGRRVQELRFEIINVQRENSDIEREIAEAQSISRLQKEVERMGFVRPNPAYVEYLVIPPFASMTPTEEQRQIQAQTESRPVDSMQEALVLTLTAAVNDLMEGESGGQ